ncbi:MAG TPA: type I restriction-modification enzyme R subunit C-terminal domain-containing protein, partial [Fimbriimonadaceae bacterium]|nr:type I restriction-modification enzyme R subunit C-terminal domain-containing protein [Fimbriimonadaceae bacterium]
EKYASLDAFLKTWKESDRKQLILKELEEHGVFFEELAKEVGKDLSAFDLVCHVAFDQPTLTRKERANNVRKRNYFTKYGDAARAVLEALLDKFANEDVDDIENIGVLKVQPLTTLGTPLEIIQRFGGKDDYLKAVRQLEDELFSAS